MAGSRCWNPHDISRRRFIARSGAISLSAFVAGAGVGETVEQTNIVNDDVAVGVVVFRKSIAGASPRLHNLYPNGFGTFWALPWVWIDPA